MLQEVRIPHGARFARRLRLLPARRPATTPGFRGCCSYACAVYCGVCLGPLCAGSVRHLQHPARAQKQAHTALGKLCLLGSEGGCDQAYSTLKMCVLHQSRARLNVSLSVAMNCSLESVNYTVQMCVDAFRQASKICHAHCSTSQCNMRKLRESTLAGRFEAE